jgi:hypothetical protein
MGMSKRALRAAGKRAALCKEGKVRIFWYSGEGCFEVMAAFRITKYFNGLYFNV